MMIMILKIHTKITMLAFLCLAITVFLFPDNHHDLMRSTIILFFFNVIPDLLIICKDKYKSFKHSECLMMMTMKIIEYSVLGKGDNMYDGII